MYTLDEAIEKSCEKLTKEELTDLVVLLIGKKVHKVSRKKKKKIEV